MYAVFYFVDLYFTLVLNYGAGKAGTNIIYFLPGLAGMFHLNLPQPSHTDTLQPALMARSSF